jgi:YbbR domain-containing protein
MRLRALRTPPVAPADDEAPPGSRGPTPPWRRWLRLPRRQEIREAFRRNPGMKLVSLLLAFFLWFSINVSERDAERTVDLQVTVRKLAPGLIVTNPPAKPVAVTLRGPRTILDGIEEARTRIALDLTNTTPGDTRIEVNGDMLRPELPRRIKVVRLEPARLKFHVEPLVRDRVPVKIDLAGTPALGYTVAESHVMPDTVEVSGPANKVSALKEIMTEEIDLRGQSENVQRDVLLAWAGDFVSFVPDHVTVSVTFEEVMVSRDFKRVDVRVLNAASGLQVQVAPNVVDLSIRGPQRLLHNFKLAPNAVYVDAEGLPAGTHKLAPRIDLQPALEATRWAPEAVTVTLSDRGGR